MKFKLEGLTCEACIRLSKMKLEKVSGVKEAKVIDLDGRVEISADRKVSLDELQSALAGTDYKIIS